MENAPLWLVVLGEEPEEEKLIEGEAVGFIVPVFTVPEPDVERADAVDCEPPEGATELTIIDETA